MVGVQIAPTETLRVAHLCEDRMGMPRWSPETPGEPVHHFDEHFTIGVKAGGRSAANALFHLRLGRQAFEPWQRAIQGNPFHHRALHQPGSHRYPFFA
jgi:hypothetical protein